MESPILWPTLFVTVALGVLGIYLLLPIASERPNRAVRGAGMGSVTVSLIVLASFCLQPAAVWSESLLSDWVGGATFIILAGLSVVSALATITCRTSANAIAFFVLMVLANAGLFLLANAQFVSVATAIVCTVVAIVCSLLLIRFFPNPTISQSTEILHEPVLGCVAGSLLAIGLIATSHFALSVEAIHTADTHKFARGSKQSVIHNTLTMAPRRWAIDRQRPHVSSLGLTLLRDHWLEIELAGALMLLALVGVTLILRSPGDSDATDNRTAKANAETEISIRQTTTDAATKGYD